MSEFCCKDVPHIIQIPLRTGVNAMNIKAIGAYSAKQPLEPMDITRRKPGPHDVQIEIAYCGDRKSVV